MIPATMLYLRTLLTNYNPLSRYITGGSAGYCCANGIMCQRVNIIEKNMAAKCVVVHFYFVYSE